MFQTYQKSDTQSQHLVSFDAFFFIQIICYISVAALVFRLKQMYKIIRTVKMNLTICI